MRSKPAARKSRGRKLRAMTSRDKVRAHRARLRLQGMRSVTIWVPDLRSSKFAAEARRQCLLAKRSPYAAEDQAWMDSMINGYAD